MDDAPAPKPKITYERLRRAQVIEAFHVAFQMVGGVPRLALWADQEPGEFFKLYARMLPAPTSSEMEGDGHVEIVHSLPAPGYDPSYPDLLPDGKTRS